MQLKWLDLVKREMALSNDWTQQRKFLKRTVISNGIDDDVISNGIDLVELQKFSKWNKGIKYLLTVIDVFSKYGWIELLKNKKTETVSKAFDDIIKTSKRSLKMLWTEFISKHFKDFLGKNKIKLVTLRMKKNQMLLRDGIKQ